MRIERSAGTIAYDCRRRWPGPTGARSTARIEIADRYNAYDLTPLDHFLPARWAVYSAPRSGIHHARAFHDPWPLHRARVVHFDDELVRVAGLPPPRGQALVHYSPSVEVRIGWPHAIGDRR